MANPALGIVRTIGRYTVFDEIASGGMATVYLGRLLGSGGFARTVAIKSLHPHLAKDPEFVAMFLDEARLAARIRHPNVVQTLDVVASKGEVFLVMDYVQGETLSRLARLQEARGQRLPLPIVVRVVSDVLQGLHAAHEARDENGVSLEIVHRDVSPQNIIVGVDGVARLLDFGVAKAAGRSHTTRDGSIKGKLSYMAPEQLMKSGLTRQTDVYAGAVVLWEMLTGRRLFTGDSEIDLVGKLIKREIPRPSQLVPEVPPALDQVVLRGLAESPAERFATAREMCAALGRCALQEAPSIAVGEWVESLAMDALADRSRKIAAIANLPRPQVASLPPPAAHDPTASLVPTMPGQGALAAPTGTGQRGHGQQAPPRDSSEPRSDILSVSVNTAHLRRGARLRAWGIGGALALLVLPAAFVLSRTIPRRESPRAAAHPAGQEGTTRFVAIPPVSSPPPPSSVTDALASTHAEAAEPSAASAVPAAPPSATNRVTPRAAPPSHRVRAPVDAVFDSRE